MKKIILLIISLSLTYAASEDCNISKEACIEGKRAEYLGKKLPNYRIGTDEQFLNVAQSFSNEDIITSDMNISQYIKDEKIEQFGLKNKNSQSKKDANDIAIYSRTKAFKKEIANNMDYLINDKELDWASKMGDYEKSTQMRINQMKSDGSPYLSQNKYLNSKERLIIVISSSMPKKLIQQYFSDLSRVNSDVVFVIRGLIGDLSKMMPTMNYFNDLLVIDKNKNKMDPSNKYSHNVTINPKIIRRFNIEKVPAIIYVNNYDPIAETYSGDISSIHDDEDVWVMYGDSEIEYSLKRINQTAKSTGIKKLIKAMNNSFFKGGE